MIRRFGASQVIAQEHDTAVIPNRRVLGIVSLDHRGDRRRDVGVHRVAEIRRVETILVVGALGERDSR